eukprot:GILI01046261.1.p1 GENE.GILI01046261.1~~GILI01046261.1.p1  ORF type:complete len:195 (-),score=55.22 GILI01046261.1:35-571(-)
MDGVDFSSLSKRQVDFLARLHPKWELAQQAKGGNAELTRQLAEQVQHLAKQDPMLAAALLNDKAAQDRLLLQKGIIDPAPLDMFDPTKMNDFGKYKWVIFILGLSLWYFTYTKPMGKQIDENRAQYDAAKLALEQERKEREEARKLRREERRKRREEAERKRAEEQAALNARSSGSSQ